MARKKEINNEKEFKYFHRPPHIETTRDLEWFFEMYLNTCFKEVKDFEKRFIGVKSGKPVYKIFDKDDEGNDIMTTKMLKCPTVAERLSYIGMTHPNRRKMGDRVETVDNVDTYPFRTLVDNITQYLMAVVERGAAEGRIQPVYAKFLQGNYSTMQDKLTIADGRISEDEKKHLDNLLDNNS